ncbi:hypothetical protein Peur_050225 [Populus x canadensis]
MGYNFLFSYQCWQQVQAVAWNHHEPQVLSGYFDRSVVMDGRAPSDPGFKWSVTADVESLAWDPHDKHLFVVSLEDGTVQDFKVLTSVLPSLNQLLATGSTDKMVKSFVPFLVLPVKQRLTMVLIVPFSVENFCM